LEAIVLRDFYAIAAQVLPVVMLALVWESRFFDRLRSERRLSRRVDPTGVLFWTKPRVRLYSLFIVQSILAGISLAMLVLAGWLADTGPVRAIVTLSVLLALGTLGFRMTVDIVAATRDPEAATARPTVVTGSTGGRSENPA
jgi:hypothetical protein